MVGKPAVEMSVTVPEGLSELLQEFTVTVLREKPDNLVLFAANYFNRLNLGHQDEPSQQAGVSGGAEAEMMVEGKWMGWSGICFLRSVFFCF